ncbi:MAG: hypothetical protein FJY91_00660 [Candidatus Harrisonbacteria bacterium]|nr:hypothetical protein [Candidatus Harrisonbacteria bacterium]
MNQNRGIFDGILIEKSLLELKELWQKQVTQLVQEEKNITSLPDKLHVQLTNYVSQKTYEEYRSRADVACADLVIVTKRDDGHWGVLLSKRGSGKSFARSWWIYGGSIPSYSSIPDFIAKRSEEESGVKATPVLLLGVYRTCAPDFVGSSVNLCYLGIASWSEVERVAGVDKDHDCIGCFTAGDIEELKRNEEVHWYPLHVASRALEIVS